MRGVALILTAAIMSGCGREPVDARIENVSTSSTSIDVTLSASQRLKAILSGQDFWSQGEVFLEDRRTGMRVLPKQTVQVPTGQGRSRFTAQFECPLVATGITNGAVLAHDVKTLSDFELVVSWNAHMFIGSRGHSRWTYRMALRARSERGPLPALE